MQVLRRGSRGSQVKLLQRLLNLRRPTHRLLEDGSFGAETDRALRDFQARRYLVQEGAVRLPTWRALGLCIEVEHQVVLFPQPSRMTCWAAAATMLFGDRSVDPGHVVLTEHGGLFTSDANVEAFAHAAGLVYNPPASRTVQAFAALARNGPLWVSGIQPLGEPTAIQHNHVVVVGAMWGDGSPKGTMLLIYDPWPVEIGNIYDVFYGERMAIAPAMTTAILHR